MQRLTQSPLTGARISLIVVLLMLLSSLPAAGKEKKKEAAPLRATVQPVAFVPVGPLGFSPPAEIFKGSRISQASLDFLDADHLLFTFRVPALIRREGRLQSDIADERRIRAVVLRLPEGTVEAENFWTVHDHSRYLYMLDHGQFLVRDRNNLYVGDASLQLKPFLRFPGRVLWAELDPTLQYLVTGSDEPPNRAAKQGEVPSPATASASISTFDPGPDEGRLRSELILRILRRASGDVMLVSHIHGLVHVPMNAAGYVETIRGNGAAQWILSFDRFAGGSEPFGYIDSYCTPLVDFLSERTLLVTTCNESGQPKLLALSMSGQKLWEAPPVGPSLWPVLVYSRDGARFARETLMATHEVNAMAPLDSEDIKGQDVQIIDSATGKVALRAAASPVMDAGGNVAISPDGRRVVILMQGALQIFELTPPPPLPNEAPKDRPVR